MTFTVCVFYILSQNGCRRCVCVRKWRSKESAAWGGIAILRSADCVRLANVALVMPHYSYMRTLCADTAAMGFLLCVRRGRSEAARDAAAAAARSARSVPRADGSARGRVRCTSAHVPISSPPMASIHPRQQEQWSEASNRVGVGWGTRPRARRPAFGGTAAGMTSSAVSP